MVQGPQEDSVGPGKPPKLLHKSKIKIFTSSLKRLLGRSSSQLRDAKGSPSPASSDSPSSVVQSDPFDRDSLPTMNRDLTGRSKALPRSVTSMPTLDLPARLAAAAAAWPSPKHPSSHSTTRKLALATSMSALSPVPRIDLCGPPVSSTVADSLDPSPCTTRSQISVTISKISSSHHHYPLTKGATFSTAECEAPTATAASQLRAATAANASPLAGVSFSRQLSRNVYNTSGPANSSSNILIPNPGNKHIDKAKAYNCKNLVDTRALTLAAQSAKAASVSTSASNSHSFSASLNPSPLLLDALHPPPCAAGATADNLATSAAASTFRNATAPGKADSGDGFPPSSMLAVCSAAPEAMRRPVWRLTDYVITGRLYRGEISSVYKAACRLSGLKVVLKVYSLSRVADNALHTLVREIRIHMELAHPAVLVMYGAFEEGNRLVLVLERALRGDLLAVRASLPRCRMSEDQVRVLVLAPLLDALSYLHGAGVCHRDIKPENILMTGGWQLRLADFGAAINVTHERAVTRTGTMDYMAPEVERCPLKFLPEDNKDNPQLSYTTAADVWSVGVLAYEMLVGFPPFINCDGGSGPRGGPGDGLGGGGGRRELCFPHFVSAGGQDFISLALSERPGDRPTAAQLLRHPWLKHALRQYLVRQQQQQQQQGQQPWQQQGMQQQGEQALEPQSAQPAPPPPHHQPPPQQQMWQPQQQQQSPRTAVAAPAAAGGQTAADAAFARLSRSLRLGPSRLRLNNSSNNGSGSGGRSSGGGGCGSGSNGSGSGGGPPQ